jgi:hypothetical protein
MPSSLSTRIAAAKRMMRRIEEDRPRFLKQIADHSEAEQHLAIKIFDDSLRRAKRELDNLLAEQDR